VYITEIWPSVLQGPLIVAAIRPLTDLPLDTHLVRSFAVSYHLLPHLLQAFLKYKAFILKTTLLLSCR